jgi:ParB family transcriptional regulator, chromosome partitioning protein
MSKKRGLGRGLDALLGGQPRDGSRPTAAQAGSADNEQAADGARLSEIPVDQIRPGQYQPRRSMDDAALQELAASIKAQGLMQPIVLRRQASGGYEIIAGERRWRAAQLAGMTSVPAVIRDVSDQRAVAMALIENIQRQDLNPLEEALALQRLQDEFALTQQQVADAVGKSRATVANLLRLLNLVHEVRTMLAEGLLEMGHARALLALPTAQQLTAAQQVVQRGLSVRQTEALVRQFQAPPKPRPAAAATTKDPDTRRLEQELSDKLGAPVEISFDGRKGVLSIAYGSMDELEGILRHIR